MTSDAAKLKRLERNVAALKKSLAQHKAAQKKSLAEHKVRIRELKGCCQKFEKWGKAEAKWSKEVTDMLRAVNWASLVTAFPGTSGTNPPQTPPDWPT